MKYGKSGFGEFEAMVNGLLSDTHRFAVLCNAVRLEQYRFSVIDRFRYPVLVFCISVDKAMVETLWEAFAALYVKELYLGYEWDETKPWDDWANALEELWIPERFHPVNGGKLPGKRMETEYFLKEMGIWMEHNHFTDLEIEQFKKENRSANVMEVGTVYAGNYCFGENEKSYFIAEMGCGYD